MFSGCKKLVQVDGPITSINSANIYENDATAASVLTGIYTDLSSSNIIDGRLPSISLLVGLSSDEFMLYNPINKNVNAYYTNSLEVQQGGYEFWNRIYPNLYTVNAAIEGLSNSSKLNPAVKQQLLGEAKFMRAFYLFYLVNLYGDVPLTVSTDYKINSTMPRTAKAKVWDQILIDLKEAQGLLSSEYLDANVLKSTLERVRPTKWAANALLARVYLYMNDWVSAEKEATLLIDNSLFGLVTLDEVFKKNNREAIWQFQPVTKGFNSGEANAFTLINKSDSDKPVLSERFLTSFDAGDQRKSIWINTVTFDNMTYYYSYKYKILTSSDPQTPVTEYSTIFRLGEQYLIRAESRIQQSKISEGIKDLNLLRDRATDKTSGAVHLAKLSESISQSDALKAIMHERQIELFSEWGHRWLDLKRTQHVDEVMKNVVPEKIAGGSWKSYQQWFPLPIYDLQYNPKLLQNTGY